MHQRSRMRRPWIKIETSTPDKPEICIISNALRMDSDTVVGKLVRLWAWMELNRVPANDLGVTKGFLDKLVGRKGFADALVSAGWLVQQDEKLGFRNMDRHNGGVAKIRAMTAQRVALHRQRKLFSSDTNVEKTLQHKPESTPDHSGNEDKEYAKINVKTQDEHLIDSVHIEHDASDISNDSVIHSTIPVPMACAVQPVAEFEVKPPVLHTLDDEAMLESIFLKRTVLRHDPGARYSLEHRVLLCPIAFLTDAATRNQQSFRSSVQSLTIPR